MNLKGETMELENLCPDVTAPYFEVD